jgi:RHS repeat-associated protein
LGEANRLTSDDDNWGSSAAAWTHGFTGHDHILQFGLININGRVFDPSLGVFLSADPQEVDPTHLSDPSPFSYVYNNPLFSRDLSGYGIFDGLSHAWNSLVHAGGSLLHGVGQFFERNWREIVVIAVVVVVAVATDGAGVGPVLSGMAAGAAGVLLPPR